MPIRKKAAKPAPLTPAQHRARHKLLHAHFDELVADFLRHNSQEHLDTTLLRLMEWSHAQTIVPTKEE
jgi:hypothetical protein